MLPCKAINAERNVNQITEYDVRNSSYVPSKREEIKLPAPLQYDNDDET
jgi:hypothetical protein